MLANAVIILSAVVSVLGILELFLSEAQKRWISDFILRIWNTLDNMNRLNYLAWLLDPNIQRYFIYCASGLSLLFTTYIASTIIDFQYISDVFNNRSHKYLGGLHETRLSVLVSPLIVAFLALLFVCLGGWIGRQVARYILRPASPGKHLLRALLSFTCWFAPSATLLLVGTYVILADVRLGLADLPFTLLLVSWLPTGMTIFLFWIVTFVPLLASYVAACLVYILEFISRRIAEFAKGPIVALSTLIGLVAGFFKVFA